MREMGGKGELGVVEGRGTVDVMHFRKESILNLIKKIMNIISWIISIASATPSYFTF